MAKDKHKAESVKANTATRSRSQHFTTLVLLLLLGCVFYLWYRLTLIEQTKIEPIPILQPDQTMVEKFNLELAELQQSVVSLKTKMAQNKDRKTPIQVMPVDLSWRYSEVEWLLRMADNNLQRFDWPHAIENLELGYHRLSDMALPELTSVMSMLQLKINQLKSQPMQDYMIPWRQLGKLINDVDSINTPIIKEAKPVVNKTEQPMEADSWQKKLQSGLEQLKGLVVIRYREDASVKPMLSSIHLAAQRALLKSHIDQARWAILSHNQPVYSRSIQDSLNILADFKSSEPIVLSMQAQLTKLQTFDVAPTIEDLSAVFQALAKQRQQV